MSKPVNVHGTGLVLGETGVLLRGPSGAGKSVLSMALLDRWEGRGQAAFLVADDRVDIVEEKGALIMLAPPQLAGLIELRGRGIVNRPHQQRAQLHLIIDLVPDLTRMIEEEELQTELLDHVLPRAPVPQSGVISLGHQMLLVAEAVAQANQHPQT
ncbi:HPr kinase/phosphatase C-terminal domain-containing protein [Devosia sp. XJ19-1]|uniref:HPr kinase/phosphatase C-terminal domain-containing protein n=1 Tax=Devosia ureilytica TaxID=2952754 RepID=A0A9Q4ALK4_9HYPH|nr:HPr kinase/phosphatase C-terminal domain-containing protein [Devosia ureilytica]MCP8883338.1 HPr kinase/phosphatase C-terminal domain-containing protein [Devosia ureilytica]MCP8886294.1 HPr kinase/phosphatase C-terminal domain-containing protein [Devosia ureilytica]